MTTSALADMIEREFHSGQVILFLNLSYLRGSLFYQVRHGEWKLLVQNPQPASASTVPEGDWRKSSEPAVLLGGPESHSQA